MSLVYELLKINALTIKKTNFVILNQLFKARNKLLSSYRMIKYISD